MPYPVFRAGGGRPRSEKDAAAALCERLDPLPGEVDNSYRLAFTQQRNAKPGTHLANCDYLRQSVFWIGGKIGNLDRLPRKQSPPAMLPRPGSKVRRRTAASHSGEKAKVDATR